MFERFTDRARRVVVLAQEEARLLHHNYIGTEHILLGLLSENEGLAARALEAVEVTLEGARAEVERRIGLGTGMPAGHIPFTPRAKKVMELSLRDALQLGHNYIGTEHLLLGLLREGEGVAAQILLTTVEGGLERVRTAVLQSMHGYAPAAETPGAASRATLEELLRAQVTSAIDTQMQAVMQRLEAIEARLSEIERLLRDRGEEAS